MLTVHKTTIVGECPHGGVDIYEAEFHVSNAVLAVETIQKAIGTLTRNAIYQENLTSTLANCLGCRVVTRGMHGRFETTCEAMPFTDATGAK